MYAKRLLRQIKTNNNSKSLASLVPGVKQVDDLQGMISLLDACLEKMAYDMHHATRILKKNLDGDA